MNSDQTVDNHFNRTVKMVEIGSSAVREIKDYKLDRYACYLVAQNGDPNKPEIAQAQTYFAVQTRRQEVFEQLPDSEKRIFIRNEVSAQNKKLFKTARRSGVSNFGLFNDAGYKGLYDMPLSEVEKKKGIKKGDLLDMAGSTELAANLFRITQTDAKLSMDDVRDGEAATRTHFMVGGNGPTDDKGHRRRSPRAIANRKEHQACQEGNSGAGKGGEEENQRKGRELIRKRGFLPSLEKTRDKSPGMTEFCVS